VNETVYDLLKDAKLDSSFSDIARTRRPESDRFLASRISLPFILNEPPRDEPAVIDEG
jgi:hypothetical protein